MNSFSKKVYLRGLIEISNRCRKNCLYCGIRCGNASVRRYELSDKQILDEAQFALDAGYGSIVLQGGEQTDSAYVERITRLIKEIKQLRPQGSIRGEGIPSALLPPLGITLSLGEQLKEVYKEWHGAGAHRYLLRIEASDRELYEKIHPSETPAEKKIHSYDTRLQALYDLKSIGYITGSGVMIGLPFQNWQNLEHDLAFFKELEVDMVGMGPYIPHNDTPLGQLLFSRANVAGMGEFAYMSNEEKLALSIEMIARLRKSMPHINIAATTALQVLAPDGRERAVQAGANVIMPNITEKGVRGDYQLYQGKPGVNDDAVATKRQLEKNLAEIGVAIGWGEIGDPYSWKL